MSNKLWNVFRDNGDPICYLLCKAEEQSVKGSEVIPIPDEFQMNPAPQPVPETPRC